MQTAANRRSPFVTRQAGRFIIVGVDLASVPPHVHRAISQTVGSFSRLIEEGERVTFEAWAARIHQKTGLDRQRRDDLETETRQYARGIISALKCVSELH
jgi:hypothetical protein